MIVSRSNRIVVAATLAGIVGPFASGHQFPPGCSSNALAVSISRPDATVPVNTTIPYTVVVAVPDSFGTECQASDVIVSFFRPDNPPDGSTPCTSTNGEILVSGGMTIFTLNPGDPPIVFTAAENPALDYLADRVGPAVAYACGVGVSHTSAGDFDEAQDNRQLTTFVVPPVEEADWIADTGGSFGDTDAWSSDLVPGADSIIRFGLPSVYTVTLDETRTIGTAEVSGGTVIFDLETFTLSTLGSGSSRVLVGLSDGDVCTLETRDGALETSSIEVGLDPGADGTIRLTDDPGSSTDQIHVSIDGLVVGRAGTGTFEVLDGALLECDDLRIGDQAEAIGSVLVQGSGPDSGAPSEITVFGGMTIGPSGSGMLSILDGGLVDCDELRLGDEPGSFGSIRVSGAGSVLQVLLLAVVEEGLLTVESPGQVTVGTELFDGSVFVFRNGSIRGDGRINANVANFGSVITGIERSEGTLGALTIDGDYVQVSDGEGASGSLTATIGPTGSRLLVTGSAQLSGALVVELEEGAALSTGSQFSILEADSIGDDSPSGRINARFGVALMPGLTDQLLTVGYGPTSVAGGGDGVMVTVGELDDLLSFNTDDVESVAASSIDLVVADLDGSSGIDVAVLAAPSDAPGSIFVLLNDGSGDLSQVSQINVGDDPSAITAADVAGDGEIDLIVTVRSTNSVSILTGLGAGVFGPPADFATGSQPADVVAGDVDADADMDLIIANEADDTLSVMANENGLFPSQTLVQTGSGPISIDPDDVDRDGCIDRLYVANRDDDSVTIVEQLTPGSGFAPIGQSPITVTGAPEEVRAVDLNGDDECEIVTVNQASSDISIVLSEKGVFAPAISVPAGTAPRSLGVADLDGDGDQDLAIVVNADDESGERVVRILRNDVDVLLQQLILTAAEEIGGGNPILVALDDVDGDDTIDLIVIDEGGGGVAGPMPALRTEVRDLCPADLDGSGSVDVDDLVSVLLAWGTGDRDGDIDGNGTVDVDDLLAVIVAWGPC